MVTQVAPELKGHRARRLETFRFYRCPDCHHLQEDLLCDTNEVAQCYSCNQRNPRIRFAETRVRRTVVTCARCSERVPLTPRYFAMSGVGFLCGCGNYVAVLYGHRFVDPRTVLRPSWNRNFLSGTQRLDNGFRFLRCRSKKDLLVLQMLQAIVKEEDSRFLFAREGDHHAAIIYDSKSDSYAGFIVWNLANGNAVLRQIFVLPALRKKGVGSALVRYWVSEIADRYSDRFGIESPNEAALNLHEKLGHIIRNKKGERVGSKCYLVLGM